MCGYDECRDMAVSDLGLCRAHTDHAAEVLGTSQTDDRRPTRCYQCQEQVGRANRHGLCPHCARTASVPSRFRTVAA